MVSGRKTRKNSQKKVLSIPQLRKSFHHVEAYLQSQLRSSKAKTDDIVRGFRKEWRKVFYKDLNVAAARSYIQHMREKMSMRGGSAAAPLTGAPLDHTLQPGVYGPYGNFPDYINKGFSVGIPQPGIQADCGVKDFTPTLPADMGSNQAGGRRRRLQTRKAKKQRGGVNPLTGAPFAAEFRPFVAENPQTLQASWQDAFKGLPPMPSSDPSVTAYTYRMPPVIGKVPGIDVAGLDRDLTKDVSVPY